MIIVYTQAGCGLARALGITSLAGHASIAFTAYRTYFSWVTTSGSKYDLDRFKTGGWSDPCYRIQIPTQEDGVASQMSELHGVSWWYTGKAQSANKDTSSNYTKTQGGMLGLAEAHREKWDKAPAKAGENPRSVLSGDLNCAEVVRKFLKAAGAEQYVPGNLYSTSDKGGVAAFTPDLVARYAARIHTEVGNAFRGAWPNEKMHLWSNPGFFNEDKKAGKNIFPWPNKPDPRAPK